MGLVGRTPTDPRPSPATPPYHRKCQTFLSTPTGRDAPKDTPASGRLGSCRAYRGGAKRRPRPRRGIRKARPGEVLRPEPESPPPDRLGTPKRGCSYRWVLCVWCTRTQETAQGEAVGRGLRASGRGRAEGPEPSRLESSDPMKRSRCDEHGGPFSCPLHRVCPPHRG
jgi:hypothetical protein